MKPINVEILLSHNVGISNSYYKPTENELLQDYLKVSDLLMIDKQGTPQKELQNYELKSQEETYLIKGKLQEKDEQIKYINEKYEKDIQSLKVEMENKFQQLISKINVSKLQ